MDTEEVKIKQEKEYQNINVFRKGNKQMKRTKMVNKLTRKAFIISLDEFAQNSTLHGLRYIVERKVSYIEKIFWFIFVIASFITCGFLIHNTWIKWQNNPVIITMDEKLVPVYSVNYPSITICPQIKIKMNTFNFDSERNHYQEFMWNLAEETEVEVTRLSKVADIAMVCDEDVRGGILNFPIKNYTVNVDNILKVALDFDDIFESCQWNSDLFDCTSFFQKVVIREGVCFTTNALDADEIVRSEYVRDSLFLSSKNYRENLSASYPIKGSVNDASPEFSVILREKTDYDDKSCKRFNTGFLIYFQDPADMPHASIHSYALNTNQIMSLAFKFDTISTSADLRNYPIQARQCYFPDEPYLKFFPTYTESNCRIECFTNYTQQLCGCVPFYMPRDNTTRICPGSYWYCVEVAQSLLYGSLKREKLNRFIFIYSFAGDSMNASLINRSKEFASDCKCLPSCYTVNYDADVMRMNYDFEYYYDFYCTNLELCNGNMSYEYAKLEWIFKRPSATGMIRSSVFGTTDFIAQCGGLLGLFLGFSLLTVVEIVYYCTLRFGCIFRREGLLTKRRENVNRY